MGHSTNILTLRAGISFKWKYFFISSHFINYYYDYNLTYNLIYIYLVYLFGYKFKRIFFKNGLCFAFMRIKNNILQHNYIDIYMYDDFFYKKIQNFVILKLSQLFYYKEVTRDTFHEKRLYLKQLKFYFKKNKYNLELEETSDFLSENNVDFVKKKMYKKTPFLLDKKMLFGSFFYLSFNNFYFYKKLNLLSKSYNFFFKNYWFSDLVWSDRFLFNELKGKEKKNNKLFKDKEKKNNKLFKDKEKKNNKLFKIKKKLNYRCFGKFLFGFNFLSNANIYIKYKKRKFRLSEDFYLNKFLIVEYFRNQFFDNKNTYDKENKFSRVNNNNNYGKNKVYNFNVYDKVVKKKKSVQKLHKIFYKYYEYNNNSFSKNNILNKLLLSGLFDKNLAFLSDFLDIKLKNFFFKNLFLVSDKKNIASCNFFDNSLLKDWAYLFKNLNKFSKDIVIDKDKDNNNMIKNLLKEKSEFFGKIKSKIVLLNLNFLIFLISLVWSTRIEPLLLKDRFLYGFRRSKKKVKKFIKKFSILIKKFLKGKYVITKTCRSKSFLCIFFVFFFWFLKKIFCLDMNVSKGFFKKRLIRCFKKRILYLFKIYKTFFINIFVKKILSKFIYNQYKNFNDFFGNKLYFFLKRMTNSSLVSKAVRIYCHPLSVNYLSLELLSIYIEWKSNRRFTLNQLIYPFMNDLAHANFFGFALKASGRFTKRQRAVIKKYKMGSLPYNAFNKNVNYFYYRLITRFGSCGLKFWINDNFRFEGLDMVKNRIIFESYKIKFL